MDPLIIRAYQLKVNDKFKKLSLTYMVNKIDDTGIYYTPISNTKVLSKEYSGHFGTACHEKIELIERSNFNE